MKTLKNKIFAITISIFFILSMTASMTLIPNANAQTLAPGKIDIQTYAFIHCGPDPVGVGQTLTVGFWLNIPPPTASGPYGDRFTGMKVTVTAPDGTNTTLGPFNSDDTGGTSTTYTPTTTGTYTFQMSYPGQYLTGGPNGLISTATTTIKAFVGDYMEPAVSNTYQVTVQQTPVGGVSVAPLPTSYWQTPINALNVNNWYVLGGASLDAGGYTTISGSQYNASANYNPWTTAPLTAHILWTEPLAFGGVLGGQFGGTTTYGNYYATAQYEKKFNPIIINGFLYYTQFPGSSTTPTANICLDLYTGKTVWSDDSSNYGGGTPQQTALTTTGIVTPLYFGQILDFVSPNQYGGLAYLWTEGTPAGIVSTGTTYNMFDAMTGKYILSVVNGTTMGATGAAGPNADAGGNMIGYYINATAGTQAVMGVINDNIGPNPTLVTVAGPSLNMWNSTACLQAGNWANQASGWYWRPLQNGVIPFVDGLQFRVPLPTSYQGNPIQSAWAIGADSDAVVAYSYSNVSVSAYYFPGWMIYAGFSLTSGQQLWIENLTVAPWAGNVNTGYSSGDGLFTVVLKSVFSISAYSQTTGKLLWTTPLAGTNGAEPDSYDSVGGYTDVIANGTLYFAGFGGDIWSINDANGKVNWYTNTTAIQGPAGANSPYDIWPIWVFATAEVAGGLLFLEEGHEYSPPLFLGAQHLALNATTGKLVWSITAFNSNCNPTTAYGVLLTHNAYDNQIYAFAKGPTMTTVNAPGFAATTSTPITISGTVTDISAGASQEAVANSFPHGLPAVSDASMTQFMEAVYEQQPMPTNITGVPVTVYVMDSNHNYRAVGSTTINANGFYSLTWTPDITGNYTITALFAGTNAYYGSSANAAFYASSPAATAAPTATPLSGLASNTTVMYIGIAIIIVIIIIGAVLAILVTRKRP